MPGKWVIRELADEAGHLLLRAARAPSRCSGSTLLSMGVELDLAGRIHAEFWGIVLLSKEIDRLAADDPMTTGLRWAHALDVLSKTARVHNGAKELLGEDSHELHELDTHPFCKAWAHDFAQGLNTRCTYDHETLALATCEPCAAGYAPCPTSMSNPNYVQRGMVACRQMRDRYEHFEGYFTGRGRFQVEQRNEPAATKPELAPWVVEGMSGGLDGDEIRVDVYERGGRRAYTLNVRSTVEALRPVLRAVTRHPEVFDQCHEVTCKVCV